MKAGVCVTIDCGHFLPGHSKCGRPHGHTYRVEAVAEGPVKDGMVIDFGDLKERLREVVRPFDHVMLNDLMPFPSCENLAAEIHRRLRDRVGMTLTLRVWEGEGKYVEIVG
jgi:6-pyruvoyltetrahydropterin/6-carboxytetrahydropterin synthase